MGWRLIFPVRESSDHVASADDTTASFARARLMTAEDRRALKREEGEGDFKPKDRKAHSHSQSFDELKLEELILQADLWDQVSLTEVSRQLRLRDQAVVGRYFRDAMEQAGVDRSRLIAIAEVYQGAGLFNFWQKVVELKPVREHDVFLSQDLYKATRAIRLISVANPEAKDYLERMALDPSIHHNNLLLRKQAFFAVKEIDLAASARILRKLPREDTLLREITAL